MKTLNNYKQAYKRAKTLVTKECVMNNASLNLSHGDFQTFVVWQNALQYEF